jgi:hypothetical protein
LIDVQELFIDSQLILFEIKSFVSQRKAKI